MQTAIRILFYCLALSVVQAQETVPLNLAGEEYNLTLPTGWHYSIPGVIAGSPAPPGMTEAQFQNQLFLESWMYELAQEDIDRVYEKSSTYTSEMQFAAIKTSMILQEQGHTIGPDGLYNQEPKKEQIRERKELTTSRAALAEKLEASRQRFAEAIQSKEPDTPAINQSSLDLRPPVMISGPLVASFKPSLRFYQERSSLTIAEARRRIFQQMRKLHGDQLTIIDNETGANAEPVTYRIAGQDYYALDIELKRTFRDESVRQRILHTIENSILQSIELTYQNEEQLQDMQSLLEPISLHQ